MRWSDEFKKDIDFTYKMVKFEIPDARFPCYGGRYRLTFCRYGFDTCYLYLTSSSLIYTYSGGYKYKIPLNGIQKVTIKQGFLLKNNYHIRFRADKKYHFVIYDMKGLTTELTGASSENVKKFIDTLKMKV